MHLLVETAVMVGGLSPANVVVAAAVQQVAVWVLVETVLDLVLPTALAVAVAVVLVALAMLRLRLRLARAALAA